MATALVACVDELPGSDTTGDEDTASIAILLSATSNGTTYRLRSFNVDLVGPVSITLSSESFAATATVMNARLPSGTYSATVHEGWRLERVDAAGNYPVPAYLAQDALDFTVRGGQTANVSFAFRTDSDFAIPGGVNVGFTIDDTAPTTWSSGWIYPIPVGVASDDMGNVYTLLRSGGSLSVQSYTSWGTLRYYVGIQVPMALTATSAFDIEAIDQGRVRVVWDANETLFITTLDAETGATTTQNQRPFQSLGFQGSIFFGSSCQLAIDIGKLGGVAVASMPESSNPDNSRLAYVLDQGATSIYGQNLNVRVTAGSANKIELALAGLDENVLLAYPNGANSTLVYYTDFGAQIWLQSTSLVTDVAADTVGNLFVLRNAGQVARYSSTNGAVLFSFSFGVAAGNSRIAAGAPGVVLVSSIAGVYHARIVNLTGTVTRDDIISFTTPTDIPVAASLDVASGVVVAFSRGGSLGTVGRIAP